MLIPLLFFFLSLTGAQAKDAGLHQPDPEIKFSEYLDFYEIEFDWEAWDGNMKAVCRGVKDRGDTVTMLTHASSLFQREVNFILYHQIHFIGIVHGMENAPVRTVFERPDIRKTLPGPGNKLNERTNSALSIKMNIDRFINRLISSRHSSAKGIPVPFGSSMKNLCPNTMLAVRRHWIKTYEVIAGTALAIKRDMEQKHIAGSE